MKKLNRRYARNIKGNLSFYLSATLLTAISAFLLVSMYTSVFMIDTGFAEILKTGNVENAQFTTLTAIDAADIGAIENKFNAEIEKVHTADIEQSGYTLRVFVPTQKINRYQLLEGNRLTDDNEILLNRDFALAHAIAVGDSFTIAGEAYKVAGFAVRPDYLYAQKDTKDFYINKASFGQATMTKAAFDRLSDTQSYYAAVFHDKNSIKVRQYLNERYHLLSYLPASSNNRIDIVRNFAQEYGVMLGMLIPLLFAMITVIVAVVMGRMVRRERKQIGTLAALGYRKRELVGHYAVYAAIPGIVGSVIGVALAIVFLRPVCLLFATDYEQINYNIRLYPVSVFLALFVPALLYILTAVISVRRLMRRNTVLLLSGENSTGGQSGRRLLVKSRLPFTSKFRLRALLSHKSRTFVVIMGMFVGTFLCAYGLIMIDSCNDMIDKSLNASGTYEYQYYLNTIRMGTPSQGEPELSFSFETENSEKQFTLSGIVDSPKYLSLSTKSGERIRYGQYYMTSNAAALYGVKAGETFTLVNPFTAEKETVKITDIINDTTQAAVYTSTENVADILGLPQTGYNVVLSDQKINFDNGTLAYANSKENLKKQLRYSINLMMIFVYLMLAFGAALCAISVYLTVNMLVEENRHNISMLKVLGYKKREINRLVLNVNHILVPVSFALSILACLRLCEEMFKAFISVLNVYIKPVISITSILLCAAMLVFSYTASLWLLKRKVYRIDMVDSLKDNRE